MQTDQIKTELIEITWLAGVEHGFACGYVGVPKDHPWFGKNCDSLNVSIHCGLTWGANHLPQHEQDGLWWLGFDTAHGGDNKNNCSKAYCEQQVESLKQQAIDAYATD